MWIKYNFLLASTTVCVKSSSVSQSKNALCFGTINYKIDQLYMGERARKRMLRIDI